jgi:hypothetical protein
MATLPGDGPEHRDDTRPVDGGQLSPLPSAAPTLPQTANKAWVGAVVAVLGTAVTGLLMVLTGNETFADVTTAEWLLVVGMILGTGGAVGGSVYQTRNYPKGVSGDPERVVQTGPGDVGAVDTRTLAIVGLLLAAVALVIVLAVLG